MKQYYNEILLPTKFHYHACIVSHHGQSSLYLQTGVTQMSVHVIYYDKGMYH